MVNGWVDECSCIVRVGLRPHTGSAKGYGFSANGFDPYGVAYRFGITHHRGKHSKRIVRTGLEDIPGIGQETAKKLLVKFGSIKGIKEAPTEEVVALVGQGKAQVLLGVLNASEATG